MNSLRVSLVLLASVLVGNEGKGESTGQAALCIATRPAQTPPKGGWPATMPAEAKAVMDRFVKAMDDRKWDKALSFCKPRTRARASHYGSEEYFRTFVPIAKLKAEQTYRFWTYARAPEGGEYDFLGCFLNLSETPDGLPVGWEWWLERTTHGWKIDLPDVPLERWSQEEIDRLKHVKERADAKWKTLEPKLKGVRTQLTALQGEYRVGQPMPFRLELINQGEHELSFDSQQVAVNGSMIVKDEAGRIVPCTAGCVQTGGWEKPIRPGASVILFASLDVARQYDMKKAGKYRVQFSGRGLEIGDAIGSRNGAARRQFPSNTVEIEVKP